MARSVSIAAENHDHRATAAHLVGRRRRHNTEPPHGFADHVFDQAADQAAHQLMRQPRRIDARVLLADVAQQAADHRHIRKVGEREQIGAQPVVEIVRIIGDVVGDRRDLGLGAGMAPEREVMRCVVVGNDLRDAGVTVLAGRLSLRIGQRAIVLDDAFQRFPTEVEPVEGRIAPLDGGDDPQSLGIVVEPAEVGEQGRQRALPACPNGGWPRSCASANASQILVQAERGGRAPGRSALTSRCGRAGCDSDRLHGTRTLGLVAEAAEQASNG